MDPSVYIPAYLERTYLASHPELTDAARELVHNDISANPQKYAQSEHAQALLSYAGVHRHLLDELHRIEDMGSDEEFEQTRNRLFDDMRDELLKIVRIDAHVLDAQRVARERKARDIDGVGVVLNPADVRIGPVSYTHLTLPTIA